MKRSIKRQLISPIIDELVDCMDACNENQEVESFPRGPSEESALHPGISKDECFVTCADHATHKRDKMLSKYELQFPDLLPLCSPLPENL
jgi:hypothetical protein